MKHWLPPVCLSAASNAFELKTKTAAASCASPNAAVLHHHRALLSSGVRTAQASFSIFCTQKTPQVHVHLGERSVCCSIGIGGSFASQFITKQLGPAADSLTAAASGPAATAAPAGAAVAKEQAGTHLQKIEIRDIIRRFSELFVSQDALLFKACNNNKEDLQQGCTVCCLSLLPRDLLSTFVGSNPAVVFHLQPATAAAADAAGAAAAAAAADMQTNDEAAYISAWPLGAPEMLRRQLELRKTGSSFMKAFGLFHLKGEKLEKAQLQSASKDSVLLASSLPDFALQPLREEVIAVVWGTPLFWEALSVDAVCTLLGEFLQRRGEENDEFIVLQEDASEFLLRKAVVQAVLRREKTVAELLYHPAALRAAGLPHWKDDRLETEQRAALGNTRNEQRLLRQVAETQEEYLNKSSLARSLSKQPFFDSDVGVLVLLFNRQNSYKK